MISKLKEQVDQRFDFLEKILIYKETTKLYTRSKKYGKMYTTTGLNIGNNLQPVTHNQNTISEYDPIWNEFDQEISSVIRTTNEITYTM